MCDLAFCNCDAPGSPVTHGARIELRYMPNDPDPIPVGSRGTVQCVNRVSLAERPFWQIYVDWDNGRRLTLSHLPDQFIVIE